MVVLCAGSGSAWGCPPRPPPPLAEASRSRLEELRRIIPWEDGGTGGTGSGSSVGYGSGTAFIEIGGDGSCEECGINY